MLIVSLYSFILRAVLVKFVATGTDPHEGLHFVSSRPCSNPHSGMQRSLQMLLHATIVATAMRAPQCRATPRRLDGRTMRMAYRRLDGRTIRMAADDGGDCPRQPSPSLTPVQVVNGQLSALQRGDVQTCFSFASPNNKRATGPWQRFEMMVRQTPAYAPLVGCARYEVVGAVPTGAAAYRCRVRVWPAEGVAVPYGMKWPSLGVRLEAPVLDYDWELTKQPEEMAEADGAGCWMVDGVMPDASPREVWDQGGLSVDGESEDGGQE